MASGRSASITRSSFGSLGSSLLCQGNTVWMTELSTKTSTDDSRIGSHSAESPTMTTSCEVASEAKMVCGEVGAQLRVSIDHSSSPSRRSRNRSSGSWRVRPPGCPSARDLGRLIDAGNEPGRNRQAIPGIDGGHCQRQVARSEEHTSDLQSRSDLV